MTYTPEKIFATGSSTTGSWNFEPLPTRLSPAQTEYTRTDVADARIKELEDVLMGYQDEFCEHGGDLCGRLKRSSCKGCRAATALKGDANED